MMNERIRELVKQAGGHFSTHTLTSYPAQRRESIELWDKNIEKFAELLLKDAFTIIKEAVLDSDDHATRSHMDDLLDARLEDAAADVVDAYGIVERIYE